MSILICQITLVKKIWQTAYSHDFLQTLKAMPGRKRKSPQSSEGDPPRKLIKDSPRLQTLPATNSSVPLSLRRAGTLMVEPGRSSSPSPLSKSIPCARTDSSILKFAETVTQANRCEKPTCIPGGLTKLALTSSGSNLSLQVRFWFDLILFVYLV